MFDWASPTPLVVLATGFIFAEGPVWRSDRNALTFSDIPGNRLLSWSPEAGVSVLRDPSDKANGNALDSAGRLVTCEHVTSRIVIEETDGARRVLASHYDGRELNSPNDLIVLPNGDILFTDPDYGRRDHFGLARDSQQPVRGVYRLRQDGSVHLLAGDFNQPNGLALCPDGRLLINDTEEGHIRQFRFDDADNLTDGELFATVPSDETGVPDGLKVDPAGNVLCAGAGGIRIFDPEGLPIGLIAVPELVGNFAFGGEDMRSLFITASTTLYRTEPALL